MGVAQNSTTGVTQDLVFGSICQGAMLVHVFTHSHSINPRRSSSTNYIEPQPRRGVAALIFTLI